jgi:hypothetical protein
MPRSVDVREVLLVFYIGFAMMLVILERNTVFEADDS